jgi:hypothetical protein
MRFLSIIFIFLYACTNSEPRGIIYEFKLVNETDTSSFLVRKHYKGASMNSKSDTLFPGDEVTFSVPRVGSYGVGFGDSLISCFFDTLLVRNLETNQAIDSHDRAIWKETSNLDEHFLEKEGTLKGKVMYTFSMK